MGGVGSGGRPTPKGILEARGSWRAKEPTRREAVGAPAGAPPLPEDFIADPELNARGIQHWHETTGKLAALGILSAIDAGTIRRYVDLLVRYERARDHVHKHGPVVMNFRGQEVPSPFVRELEVTFDRILKLDREFGFTPSSRSTLSARSVTGGAPSTGTPAPADGGPSDDEILGLVG